MGVPGSPIPVVTIPCFFIKVPLKTPGLLHSSLMRGRPFFNFFFFPHKHQKLPRKPDKEGKDDDLQWERNASVKVWMFNCIFQSYIRFLFWKSQILTILPKYKIFIVPCNNSC